MPKIDVQKVAEILQHNDLPPPTLRRIIEEINNEVRKKEGGEKSPAQKKQWVILISDPEKTLPKVDLVGWVLQIPEDESPVTAQDRVFRGAYDFNASKRGRLLPVKTVGEAIENVPVKHFKKALLWVKTKVPVIVLTTDNNIPQADAE